MGVGNQYWCVECGTWFWSAEPYPEGDESETDGVCDQCADQILAEVAEWSENGQHGDTAER